MALSQPFSDFERVKQSNASIKINNKNSMRKKSNLNNKNLIIYDPKSSRQMQSIQNVPPLLGGNARKPKNPNGNRIELPQLWNPCLCADLQCTCCLGIKYGESLNQRLCIALQYKLIEATIELRIVYNANPIATFGFSARNPAPTCVPILLPLPILACVRIFDIRLFDGNVNLCASVMLRALTNNLYEVHLNCIRFGANGVRFLARNQLPEDVSEEHTTNGEVGRVIINADRRRENANFDENYSGISVEGDRAVIVPVIRGANARRS